MAGTEGLSFRLRVNVCRGPMDVPAATSYICGVGQKNSPINGDNTKPQSLETTMRQWGLENETESLKKTLKEGSENLLRRIIEHENKLDDEERGNIGAQTDVIGKCWGNYKVGLGLEYASTGFLNIFFYVNFIKHYLLQVLTTF